MDQTIQQPTQVVLLTPPGRGAVASVLVEGPRATEVVFEQFHPAGDALDRPPMGRIVFGHWGNSTKGAREEVVVCRCGPELFEIHCHGGTSAPAMVIESLVQQECRKVDWRDWVERHEQDPIAAHALVALTEARTERAAAILLDQYNGALRQSIDQILAALDHSDFSGASGLLETLLDFGKVGLHLTRPWRVVLAGEPNVGKSSLINALVGYQRSIVLDVPGTTRDIVTAGTALDGWPVELADTAGLRANVGELEAAGQLGFDHEIETAGQQKARQQMDRADLVVLVFDSSRPWSLQNTALAEAWPNSLQVHNKCDLVSGKTDHRPGLQVSALSGEGVDVLVGELGRQLVPNPPPAGSAVPFTTEQVDSFVRATEAITAGETTVAAELLQKLGK